MFFNQEAFESQLKELEIKLDKSEIITLREIRESIKTNRLEEDYSDFVDRLVCKLFYLPYLDKMLLPWEFIRSPIGEVITSILYKTESDVVYPDAIAEHMDVSYQYVIRLFNQGKIKGNKDGNRWKTTKSAANKYLVDTNRLPMK